MRGDSFGERCERCGMPRSEYRDLGTKGRYVCWWCRERAADPVNDLPPYF